MMPHTMFAQGAFAAETAKQSINALQRAARLRQEHTEIIPFPLIPKQAALSVFPR